MEKPIAVGVSLVALLLAAACNDRTAEEKRAREEAEAKARAEAARKEMEALPRAFQTPDYFKKNQPSKKPESSAPKK